MAVKILHVGDRRRSIDSHCRQVFRELGCLHGLADDCVQHGGEFESSDKLRECCCATLVGAVELKKHWAVVVERNASDAKERQVLRHPMIDLCSSEVSDLRHLHFWTT